MKSGCTALFAAALTAATVSAQVTDVVLEADLCVYGATSAGVIAAVQAAREGRSVILLDADGHIGGMTTSGLGATDVGNQASVGGLAREFYRALRRHYEQPSAWRRQRREEFRGRGHEPDQDAAWTFEPHVAAAAFDALLASVRVTPVADRLDRGPGGVRKVGTRIGSIRTEQGRLCRARVYVDCSYEGDLLAAAGCSFVVGREANSLHGETLNGVQRILAIHHQFAQRVDPFVRPGNPDSGLLPGIELHGPGSDGSADAAVQACCFRLCATDDPELRVPWQRPDGYDERDYELLLRWFDAGARMPPWHPVWLPNRKADCNNNGPVSTDWIGGSWRWPGASYEERAELWAAHRRWQMGLLWTLANHPRVPAAVRDHFQAFGLARDEFAATGHWPPLLYVREGRRLCGELIVTEHHCRGELREPDPVGMGAYAMDSHHVRRHVEDGAVRNEGDVQVRVVRPYGISWRALQPQRSECTNLVVPVAVSATHIAFGSIRMEPVFMVLAQSAAIAAGIAIDEDCAVQDVAYDRLVAKLLAAGQVVR